MDAAARKPVDQHAQLVLHGDVFTEQQVAGSVAGDAFVQITQIKFIGQQCRRRPNTNAYQRQPKVLLDFSPGLDAIDMNQQLGN